MPAPIPDSGLLGVLRSSLSAMAISRKSRIHSGNKGVCQY